VGLSVATDGHQVLVEIRDEATFDAVRDVVTDLRLGLVRLEPRRGRLEDLFREPGSEEAGGALADGSAAAATPGVGAAAMPPGESSERAA
jgi:ABC-2 type transport system ATP-binding protein